MFLYTNGGSEKTHCQLGKAYETSQRYGGGLLESTHSGPQDRPTSNDEGSRTTTPIKNINLLNDRLEAREQGNRSRFKKYEVLIELLGFENRAVIWTMSPPIVYC